MNQTELKLRMTAWAWAATTLGVEVSPDRIKGLVEVTRSVPVSRIKTALERVIETEPQGFMPSPGAVIAAARQLAERDYASETRSLSAGREMSKADHDRWMAENNPEGWDNETWGAFVERISTDARFESRVRENFRKRHEWAEEQVRREIGSRKVDAGFRIDLRRRMNIEAIDQFPRPNPLEDGWVPSRRFDPLSGLTKRMSA